MVNNDVDLMPFPYQTESNQEVHTVKGYEQLEGIPWPPNGFFSLHNVHYNYETFQLPLGYDYYVLSWQGEYLDFSWIQKHSHITKPVIILTEWKTYDCTFLPDNFIFVRWMYAHRLLEKMISWFGTDYHKDIKYKASTFCHRITQSKVWITTALLETLPANELFVKLNDQIDLKNVHYWELCGNELLDNLTTTFREKWFGKKMLVDNFQGYDDNHHKVNADPAHPAYSKCAIHFTNESWHYSQTLYNGQNATLPGPNFSEKTYKCLLSATPFIAVGQFDTYSTLEEFGLKFDYGKIDLSFDKIPGDIDRFEKIINLIVGLKDMTIQEIYDSTRECTEYNQNIIVSGEFAKNCTKFNLSQLTNLEKIVSSIG